MKKKTKLISNITRVTFTFILLSIFNYSLFINDCYPQWIQQNSGVSVNLYDVEFINLYTGWAVGENGTVIKTTNSGVNWIFVTNPAYGMGKILNSIHPVDSNVICFVGAHSTLIKTTNGGMNWIEIRNGPWGSGMGFMGVYMLNKDTGWFCGNMRVLRTTNGCQTFDSAGIFAVPLADICFKDFNTGLVCTDGIVFKSTDGGMNWFNSNVPTHGHYYPFNKLAVVNKQYVWVIGGGNPPVYRTTNFAVNWDSLTYIPAYPPSIIYCTSFSSENIGWAGGSFAYLYKTTNGGFNWLREETGSDQRFWGSLWFHNDTIGWGVGGGGKIYYTTTGGQTMVNITNLENEIPNKFILYQNYPNPFNSQTTIKFDIREKGNYRLAIYDLLRRKQEELFNERLNAGSYKITYNADKLSSGVYFYRLYSEKMFMAKKFLLIK